MRVSTSMIFNSGMSGLLDRQADLYRIQNQLSSGRKILSPEDDPIGASEALEVTQSKGVTEQYLDNQAAAISKLGYADSALESVGNELLSIYERAVQAGNSSYSPQQRGMIAEELKRRMESLVGLANTQDGTGQYVFAGYQTASKPFEVNTAAAAATAHDLGPNTYVSYNGDAGRPALQVSGSKTMETSENGLDVFMLAKDPAGNVIGRSVFDGVQNMIDILDGTRPFTTADYDQAVGDISASVSHVSTVRASVGARLNALDALASSAEDVNYLYDVRLSELQDLDYTEAISEYSRYQVQLEAAQLTFKQISQMSLFNIL